MVIDESWWYLVAYDGTVFDGTHIKKGDGISPWWFMVD
jgi:hypothetical protein